MTVICEVCGGPKGDLIHPVGRWREGMPGHAFKPIRKFKNDMELAEYFANKRVAKLERLCEAVNKEIMTYRMGDCRIQIELDTTGSMIQIKPKVTFYC